MHKRSRRAAVEAAAPLDDNHNAHVCVFTTAHPVDDVRVHSKMAVSFLNAGFRVTWVGPGTSYFTASTTPNERIRYLLLPPLRSRSDRLLSAPRATRMAARVGPVDWWYCPDPDAALAAISVARRLGGRVIFDIHEVFHGALLDRWLPFGRLGGAGRAAVRRLIAFAGRRVALILAVSRPVLTSYAPVSERSLVIRNCAPSWFADHHQGSQSEPARRMRVVHGKILASNGTSTVLDALEHGDLSGVRVLLQRSPNPESPFVAGVLARAATRGLRDVLEVLPSVPHQEMPALLAAADVGMIAYGRGFGTDSLPNRLFEYMAAGLAILAPSYAAEIREIVEAERIGLTVDFEDPAAIAVALRWLRDHPQERKAMGSRARGAFLARHNWDHEFEKLLAGMASVG